MINRVMSHWRTYLIEGADLPVIGAAEDQLRSIRIPTCVVPGNDRIHARRAGENAGRMIPGAEVHDIMPPGPDVEEIPFDEWERRRTIGRGLRGFPQTRCLRRKKERS